MGVSDRSSLARLLLSGISAATLLLGLISAPPVLAQEKSQQTTDPLFWGLSTTFPFCSWWIETSTQDSNILYPDTNAAYWTVPFQLNSDDVITLRGYFIDARYFSLQVYNSQGQLDSSEGSPSLTDFQLTPDQGSVNPWASDGGYPVTAQSYTVSISSKQARPADAVNWLPMPTPQQIPQTQNPQARNFGFLMLRVYMPNTPPFPPDVLSASGSTQTTAFDQIAQVLPTMSVTKVAGATSDLPQCSARQADLLMRDSAAGKDLEYIFAGSEISTVSEQEPDSSNAKLQQKIDDFRATLNVKDIKGNRLLFQRISSLPTNEALSLIDQMSESGGGAQFAAELSGNEGSNKQLIKGNDREEIIKFCQLTECSSAGDFFRPTQTQTPFPNLDSAYVASKYQLDAGDALVVTLRLPTTPWNSGSGSDPVLWPVEALQLRYLSFCNYVYQPPFPVVVNQSPQGPIWGCSNDVQIHEESNGSQIATAVATRNKDKPAQTDSLKDFVWLPLSQENSNSQHVFAVRNMLPFYVSPDDQFTNSATNIQRTNDPTAAAVAMASYYPVVAVCEVKLLEKLGSVDCAKQYKRNTICGPRGNPGQAKKIETVRSVASCLRLIRRVLEPAPSDREVARCLLGVTTDCGQYKSRMRKYKSAELARAFTDHAAYATVEAQRNQREEMLVRETIKNWSRN